MTDDQIKHMVERFLFWKLPDDFRPDGGISIDRIGSAGTPYEFVRQPVGTNLLTATQAAAMVRHMVDGLPGLEALRIEQLEACLETQKQNGNWNCNPYMHGMANGMILALAVLRNVAGDVQFLAPPDRWLDDLPKPDVVSPETSEAGA